MTLSTDTLTILKNFAVINPSVKLKKGSKKEKGSVLRTMSSDQAILVDCKVPDIIPADLCIFDLRQFLSSLELFKNPQLECDNEKYVTIREKEAKSSVRFFLTNEDMINVPKDNISGVTEAISGSEIKFTLSQSDLALLLKASSIFNSKNITVFGNSDGIFISALDYNKLQEQKNQTGNSYTMEVAESNGDNFNMIFNADNMKILPGSYEVSICSQGLSAFKHTELENLTYYIALEESSEYSKGQSAQEEN